MKQLLKQIEENISGIWGNKKYVLVLGLDNTFFFEEKKSKEIIDGFYSIIELPTNNYPTLRLTDLNGNNHDYLINELSVFETLAISQKGKKIRLKNVPPDEYEGETINPVNN